jgi:hypothetical protein
MKSSIHKKAVKKDEKMRSEYDFSSGEDPRYDKKYPEGAIITVHRDGRKASKKQIENKFHANNLRPDGINLKNRDIRK